MPRDNPYLALEELREECKTSFGKARKKIAFAEYSDAGLIIGDALLGITSFVIRYSTHQKYSDKIMEELKAIHSVLNRTGRLIPQHLEVTAQDGK